VSLLNPFGVADALAQTIFDALRERSAGPETPETMDLSAEIAHLRMENAANNERIAYLEDLRYKLRRQAKGERSTWWSKNREALIAGIVSNLVVSIPIFLLGVLVTLLLARR
jgi:hypothetical protein